MLEFIKVEVKKDEHKHNIQLLWLMSNLTTDEEVSKRLIEEINLIDWLYGLVDKPKVRNSTLQIIGWNIENLSRHSLIGTNHVIQTAAIL